MRKRAMLGLVLGAAIAARIAVRRRRKLDLRDKVVVVTGGSRGLGLVLARTLVQRGAKVAICARDAAELERARLELATMGGGEVYASACDVTDRDDIIRFIT